MFVDWRSLNNLFCGAMWVLVVVLALVILIHQVPATPAPHHEWLRALPR